jgi:predicted DCC family thiol-disulfide oxidoreductase YuxK
MVANESQTDVPITQSSISTSGTSTSPNWQIKLLYDGACPLCVREVKFLQAKDADRGLVAFVDIADEHYTPDDQGGVDFETAMGRIHAVLPDGTVIKNVEVFRQIYTILGMGWIYAPTRWPLIGPIVDRLYSIWADLRLKLTGRPDLATIVAERQQRCACRSTER